MWFAWEGLEGKYMHFLFEYKMWAYIAHRFLARLSICSLIVKKLGQLDFSF